MNLPTSVPNKVLAPIVYPKHMDNNWGHYMNDNFEHIATKADDLKIDVRAKAMAIEVSTAKHFATLKDAMNKAAEDYIATVKASRQNVMLDMKAIIDGYVAAAVDEMLKVTQAQLDEISETKSTLLVAITDIQSNFHLTEGYIQAGIEKINKRLDSEIEASASSKSDIATKVKTVRDLLLEHMSDFNNPHEFNGGQGAGNGPVYQPDPIGTEAIFPLSENDVIVVTADEETVVISDPVIINEGDDNITISGLST